jgi:hypothetical protein
LDSSLEKLLAEYAASSVKFEVFKAVTVKNSVFWGMTPPDLLKAFRRFGKMYYRHLLELKSKLCNQAASRVKTWQDLYQI